MTDRPEAKDATALSDLSFWDGVSAKRLSGDQVDASEPSPFVAKLNALCSDYTMAMAERIAAQHLKSDAGCTMLEVGCAPGNILTRFHRRLSYQPFGLEYAAAGVEDTRRNFVNAGFDPQNVYPGDLFDPETAVKHGGRYDLVMSFGLIEHFSDPRVAVECHLKLVKPGGYLLMYIPKLTGISYLSMWVFRREFIKLHNLSIMRRATFAALFEGMGMESLYCGHVGFIQMYGLFSRRERTLRGVGARVANRAQMLLNASMRTLFLGRNVTWGWSPALLYIGRKPSTVADA